MSIVAIASASHCSGAEIARELTDRLGATSLGEALFETIAQRFDGSPERTRQVLFGRRSPVDRWTHESERAVAHFQAALSEQLNHKRGVYHGPGVHLIPPSLTHVLRVAVLGTLPFRIGVATMTESIDAHAALRQIARQDARRERWSRRHVGAPYWQPNRFDLVLTRPGITVGQAVDRLVRAATREGLRPTQDAIQAQRDFRLSTRVRLALLEQGQHGVEVAAQQGRVSARCHTRRSPAGRLPRAVHALRQEARLREVSRICLATAGVRSARVFPGLRLPQAVERSSARVRRSPPVCGELPPPTEAPAVPPRSVDVKSAPQSHAV